MQSSIQAATRARAAALVANCSTARNPDCSAGCQDPVTALSSAEPGLPIDWQMPRRPQAARTGLAVYPPFFLLLVIVAIVLGTVGVVAKGLLYLMFIGIVVFLAALIFAALRMRRRRGRRAAR